MSVRNVPDNDRSVPFTHRVAARKCQGGYSEFFRERSMPDFWWQLTCQLQAILKAQPVELKIVVVGCSTGEEVYSVAMLVRLMSSKIQSQTKVRIIGIDKDQGRIEAARKGEYRKSHYCVPPGEGWAPEYQQYFMGLGAGGDLFSVRQEIRQMAEFYWADIERGLPGEISGADLVLAHNVVVPLGSEGGFLRACLSAGKKGGLFFTNKREPVDPAINSYFASASDVIFDSKTDLVARIK